MLDERTAFLIGRHTLKIGILAFEYGLTDRLSIGTDPPAWALRAVRNVLIPNVHLKAQLLALDPVWVSVVVAGFYGYISGGAVAGHLMDLPVSLFASVKIHPRIYLHGEGNFTYVRAFGSGDLTEAQINGAAAASAAQLGLMAQFRLTRIFSLTATGRYQAWVSDVPFSGSARIDPYTTASVNGQLVPGVQHPWELIGGVALLWTHVRLIAGAGYGYYFVPGLNVANTRRTFVPDLSLAVIL